MEEPFVWFHAFRHLQPFVADNPWVPSAGLVLITLLIFSLIARRRLKSEEGIYPSATFGISTLMEMILEGVIGLMDDIIGPRGRKFLPLIGSLALFIFFSNLMGLLPGFLPPTQSWNTTAACAIVVFLTYHFFGFKENGIGYLKHFTGPVWYLAPLMFPIELISHFVRPLSLSLRLLGNITGDHLVIVIFLGIFPFIAPMPFILFGLLVSVIQTMIFILLSMVYISMATEHEGH